MGINHKDNIVITGAGLVTCLGLDCETTWKAVRAGRCGVAPLTAIESPLDSDLGGGEVHVDAEAFGSGVPREVGLLRRACDEALCRAGIEHRLPCEPQRCAVVLGTSLHGMRNGGAFLRGGDANDLRPFLAGATLSLAVDGLSAAGFCATTCSACSSGLASVTLGHSLLQNGDADLVIAGGYDPISEYAYAGFNALRLVSPTDLRPFAATRDGMKLGEGYAVVVLERSNDARARGAAPLALIAGFGESCDAYHLSKPHPEGAGAAAAMRIALDDARLSTREVDMLVAHATATPDNDASEHAALAQVFADRLHHIPIVGFKSHLGHSLGAAGAVDLILSALAIRDKMIPPCANVAAEDNGFDDLLVSCGTPRRRKLRYVLNTSLGFGGANVCLILGAPETISCTTASPIIRHREAADRDPVITGVGVVLPGAICNDAFVRLMMAEESQGYEGAGGAIESGQYAHLVNARRTRRMSNYARLALAATSEAYRDAGIDDQPGFGESCAAIAATTHGPTEYCERFYKQILTEGIEAANPALFAEGVPNVASAHLSTNFSIKGFCQTIIGTRTAGLEALLLATARIRSGVWDRAVVVAAEDKTDLITDTYATLLAQRTGCASSDRVAHALRIASGAVALVLESRRSAADRGARVRGSVARINGVSWSGCTARQRVSRASDLIQRLGAVDALAASANGTVIDRLERAAIRRAYRHGSGASSPVLATLYDRTAETFSVGPLAAVATALLCSRFPALSAIKERESTGQAPTNAVGTVAVLCTDYMAGACGAVVRRA